jgi:biopolymer transport protein ExbB/TolQ
MHDHPAGEHQQVSLAAPSIHPVVALASSPLLWGLVASVAFYLVIPYLPIEKEFVARYFAGHWIEYATTGMCIIGLAILVDKLWKLRAERAVFRAIPESLSGSADDIATRLSRLEGSVATLPARLRRTMLGQRLADVCEYLRGRTGAGAIEEHLRYLGELGAAQLHGSYALLRTLTWAIPILGFLGTVIGITMAIANITPEQLESSLGDVTAGLAVAFDTTALSLALSMVLVFATYFVEKWEGNLAEEVEQFGVRKVLTWFAPAEESVSPWAEAETQAARQLLEATESLIGRQTGLWQESLESLRRGWLEVARHQQDELAGTLREGMAETLADHAHQLAGTRGELVGAIQETAMALRSVAETSAKATAEQQARSAALLGELWSNTSERLESLPTALREELASVSQGLAQSVELWHADLAQTTVALRSQTDELLRQGELLGGIVEDERQLIRLQDVLQQNLSTVRAADTFEQTLHSLSAAVHLLTARTKHAA